MWGVWDKVEPLPRTLLSSFSGISENSEIEGNLGDFFGRCCWVLEPKMAISEIYGLNFVASRFSVAAEAVSGASHRS